MFETPDQFRNRIRETLKGSFAKEAEAKGIQTLSEVDPQGEQQSVQAPPQQDKFNQSITAAFDNILMAIAAKGQLESGTKIDKEESAKATQQMYKAINDPNTDIKTMANIFKKIFGNRIDSVVNKVESLSKKKQQDQQKQNQQGQQDSQPKQLNAEEGHGDDLQVADEAYGDGVKNFVSPTQTVGTGDMNAPVTERNDPISVDAMQGILKFATPQQIADAIKKMTPEDFQQFTNGLQKTALDVIAKAVNAGGTGAGGGPTPSGQGKNNNPTGSGGNTDKEGNLKLGDL